MLEMFAAAIVGVLVLVVGIMLAITVVTCLVIFLDKYINRL
jgi:hypothetical protein